MTDRWPHFIKSCLQWKWGLIGICGYSWYQHWYWWQVESTLLVVTLSMMEVIDYLWRTQCSFTYSFISCFNFPQLCSWNIKMNFKIASQHYWITCHRTCQLPYYYSIPLMSSWMMLFDLSTAQERMKEYMTFLATVHRFAVYHCTSCPFHGSMVQWWRSMLNPMPIHVRFVVDRVVLEHAFLWPLQSATISSIPQVFHTHILFIYCWQ